MTIESKLNKKEIESGDFIYGKLVDDIDYKKKELWLQSYEDGPIQRVPFSDFENKKKKKLRKLS